jgi:hypothetical protein
VRVSRENWRRVVLFLQLIAFAVLAHLLLGLGQNEIPEGKNYIMTCIAWMSIGLGIIIKVFPGPADA